MRILERGRHLAPATQRARGSGEPQGCPGEPDFDRQGARPMNLSQQSPPSRPASATPVAVLIVFLLLASVIAFLRGPRAAAGLTGVALAAATPATRTSAIPTERPAVLRPDRLRASATAEPALDASGERVSYGAANLVDDDPTTAWRVSGDGVGTTIRAEWDEPVALTSIGVVPGYAKVDAADHTDRFHQERRVVAVRCSFDHDPAVTVTFADLAELQTFTVDVRTRRVTIEITRTTAAPERDFTAISELAFVGNPA